jgi:hypothetical protein
VHNREGFNLTRDLRAIGAAVAVKKSKVMVARRLVCFILN